MEFFGFELTFVMFAGIVVALLGIAMLMLSAFATSAAWGFASLLIPPLAIGFALTHFEKGRNGLVIIIIGSIIFSYGSFDYKRVQKMQAIEQEEEAIRVEPVLSLPAQSRESADIISPASPPARLRVPAERASVAPTIINMIDAHKFVGNEIRLTLVNGSVRVGVLKDVSSASITIDYHPKGSNGRITSVVREKQVHLMELIH